MLFDLSGVHAIVTGATGSLGQAAAAALVEAGVQRLTIVGRNPQALLTLAKTLRTSPQSSAANTHASNNASNSASTPATVIDTQSGDLRNVGTLENILSTQSGATVLVNVVGYNNPKHFLSVSEEDFDRIMETNIKSAFFQTQAFVRMLRKDVNDETTRTPASIIHISSQMGLVGGWERSAYCASKHAMEGMVKAVAYDVGKWGIRINTICPTFIETAMTAKTLSDPQQRQAILQEIPLNRLGKSSDIGGAVVYLAAEASSLVTGSAIVVDGGWTAH